MCKYVPPFRLDHEVELSLVITVGSDPWKHMGHHARAQWTAHWWVTISWEVCCQSFVTKNKLPTFVNDLPGFMQGVNQSWRHYHACISLLLPVQHRCRWSCVSVEATTWTYWPPSIHSTGICKAPTLCKPCPRPGGYVTHRTDVRSALRKLAK